MRGAAAGVRRVNPRTARRARGLLERLHRKRVSLPQLLLLSGLSAGVSVLIVVSALGETGAERAVIAALRTAQVIHAPAPSRSDSGGAASISADAGAGASASSSSVGAASAAGGGGATGDNSSSGATQSSVASSDSTGASGSSSRGASSAARSTAPASKIKHVFVIAVSTPSYTAAFGHGSAATYLNSTLRPRGALLSQYHALGTASLADDLAMISGQAPNHATESNCPTYSDFAPNATPAKNGLVPGTGCVYPNTALTIADQLSAAALHWQAAVDGMTSACEHPNSGATDAPVNGYDATDNPFVFFHSLLDLGACQSNDLPYTRLAQSLTSARRTANLTLVAPDSCDSGAGSCPAGQPTGLAAADAFLKRTVPLVLRSPAYRKDGALLIVFNAAPASAVPQPPASSNSLTTTSTTSSTATATSTTTPGATTTGTASAPITYLPTPIRTGLLVLSRYTKGGTTNANSYDPYSVLRSLEQIFGQSALGKARSARAFATQVF
jgi:phosphatidylinositol-3-phosphatase